jgi:hypothetical protein
MASVKLVVLVLLWLAIVQLSTIGVLLSEL